MYSDFLKPILDVLVGLIAFLVSLPVFVTVILLLTFVNSGKPFFIQIRPGKNERLFRLIKFKTMNNRMDESGKLLPDKERLTRIGRFVRSTSLDELPQLINVIMGDMSLIGPRPLLVKYLDRYTSEQKRRHDVKPGITGWAQINGRNAISWQKKFELDIYYVDNMSFLFDLKIIWLTFLKVVRRADINSVTTTTMEEFKG